MKKKVFDDKAYRVTWRSDDSKWECLLHIRIWSADKMYSARKYDDQDASRLECVIHDMRDLMLFYVGIDRYNVLHGKDLTRFQLIDPEILSYITCRVINDEGVIV